MCSTGCRGKTGGRGSKVDVPLPLEGRVAAKPPGGVAAAVLRRSFFAPSAALTDPLWRCALRPYARAPGVRHSKSQIVGFSFASRTVPHPPQGGRIRRRTSSSPRPASQSGHCQRSGSGAHGRAFLMFSTWRDFRAPLGVCPEVGRSQRPLHVHSMDKTPRVLRILRDLPLILPPQAFTCSFQPGHAAAGRRPVSGPRGPGYHTRAGGHRHSPLIPVPDPVPQERWADYAGGVWGCGKIGSEKMCGVNGNNGLSGN
jgi:hypothetical protein